MDAAARLGIEEQAEVAVHDRRADRPEGQGGNGHVDRVAQGRARGVFPARLSGAAPPHADADQQRAAGKNEGQKVHDAAVHGGTD
jgi:hypothetical protein